ncbi:hypothetical protein [Ferrovibrio terrae]|uniref:hypothetical protein n=1 Tax=Ferrovibrio terrae TaxID=2594003 RepID=UPI003137C4AF
MRRLPFLLLPLILAACGEEKPTLPAEQQAFCRTISEYRDRYRAATGDQNRLAGQQQLDSLVPAAKAAFAAAVPGGQIRAWRVTFTRAYETAERANVVVVFDLGCGARLKTDTKSITAADALGRTIIGLKAGGETVLNGRLLPPDNNRLAFREWSMSLGGTFLDPEYGIAIESVAQK